MIDNDISYLQKAYQRDLFFYLSKQQKKFPLVFMNLLKQDLIQTSENRLSIGMLYLLLTLLQKQKVPDSIKIQIGIRLDVLSVLCDYLDDIVDEDSSIHLSINELLVNTLSLLFSTIKELYEQTSNFLDTSKLTDFFAEAINGERLDFYSVLSKKTKVKSYFSNMLKKSIPLMQLVCYIACPTEEIIWKNFAQCLATAFQLQNDAADIMDISKSDLRFFKETLPFIKSIEYAKKDKEMKFLDIVERKLSDDSSLNYLAAYIKKCGAVEYSLRASVLYTEKAFQVLKEQYSNQNEPVEWILNYLKGVI